MTTAIGLFVAIPAVWMFNYFTGKIEAFDVEMGNSSSELIDYFLKRSQRAGAASSLVELVRNCRRVEFGAALARAAPALPSSGRVR